MFPMAHSWLQHLIWTQIPSKFRLQIDAQEVITRPKVSFNARTCRLHAFIAYDVTGHGSSRDLLEGLCNLMLSGYE